MFGYLRSLLQSRLIAAATKLAKEALTSKKAVATIVTAVVSLVGRYQLNIDPESIETLVKLVIGYVLAQGIADFGKEAVKIEAQS